MKELLGCIQVDMNNRCTKRRALSAKRTADSPLQRELPENRAEGDASEGDFIEIVSSLKERQRKAKEKKTVKVLQNDGPSKEKAMK